MNEIVKAGPNTATYPMHPWMVDEIQAWERGVAASSAQQATTNRYQNYLSGPFKAWWDSYYAGRAEEPAPAVPEGFDAQIGADGLEFDLVGSGAPCGPPPTYKQRVKTPTASIFGALTPATDQLAAFDAAALTNTITRPNGHVFMRIA